MDGLLKDSADVIQEGIHSVAVDKNLSFPFLSATNVPSTDLHVLTRCFLNHHLHALTVKQGPLVLKMLQGAT